MFKHGQGLHVSECLDTGSSLPMKKGETWAVAIISGMDFSLPITPEPNGVSFYSSA
jgi:hypothetical protein